MKLTKEAHISYAQIYNRFLQLYTNLGFYNCIESISMNFVVMLAGDIMLFSYKLYELVLTNSCINEHN